ncbi:FkbM family methyltransferase, partial [Bacteroidota bacterium]
VGVKKFYKIGFTNARWAAGLSSFYRDNIELMINAGYIQRKAREDRISLPANKDNWIVEIEVKTETLKNIIRKHNLQKLDLIIIDAERYDYEIIKTIPFDLIKPNIIIYEHAGLNESTIIECNSFLRSYGYNLKITESDTIAYFN